MEEISDGEAVAGFGDVDYVLGMENIEHTSPSEDDENLEKLVEEAERHAIDAELLGDAELDDDVKTAREVSEWDAEMSTQEMLSVQGKLVARKREERRFKRKGESN